MTFVLATLLLALFGLILWRLPLVQSMDWPARVAIAFMAGIVIGGLVMYAEAVAGIPWTRAALLIPAAMLCGATRVSRVDSRGDRTLWAIGLIFLLALYGAWSARMTCGDLLYFWGPKAVHFFDARTIDVEFLRFPHYFLMHPDYPPLQTFVNVWSAVITGDFSYRGAVLVAPVLLLATALIFRAFAGGMFAILLAALLAFAFTAGRAAGGADPLLLLFETTALSVLTFAKGRDATILASIALAGAALTKVEGAAFVVAVLIALLITRRFRETLAAFPAVALLATWILFARHHGLLDSYGRADKPVVWQKLGYVLYMTGWQASYRVFWLPWIVAIAALPFATTLRRAAFPLLVAALTLGYTIFFYLHEPDPLWWIKASAERVLMTTLVSLVVASAASSEYSPRTNGVVP
jgi:hypothetical protein